MAITTALIMGGLGTAASAAIGTAASMGAASLMGAGGGGGGGSTSASAAPLQAQTGLFSAPIKSSGGAGESMTTAGTFDTGSNPFQLRDTAVNWMTPREVT
tara:strand:+ start:2266 stop:2568 length:303 start_codon:yes stop_codon:yes gene_type:complete